MKLIITVEVDKLPTGYGNFDETIDVIREAIDNQLIGIEVYAKRGIVIEVEE